MVIELLSLVASYHLDREHEYNERNPGLIAVVGIQHTEWLRSYVTAGAYVDSYSKTAPLAGVGFDIGKSYGVSVALAHVNGSDMESYPVVPLPSLFIRGENHGVRILFAPDASAFAFGYTYTFTN